MFCAWELGPKLSNLGPCFIENYLETFKKTSLPINLDRDAVFEIVNNGSRLHEINNSFKRFIPTELLKRNLNSTFKSLNICF